VLLLVVGLTACNLIQRVTSPNQAAATARAAASRELQLKVMRFADEYVGRTVESLRSFQIESTDTRDRLAAQTWKIEQATAVYTIASGPIPEINALDMVVLATLSRMVIEDHWVSELYGNRVDPLKESLRVLEARAWDDSREFLTPAQSTQLRELIDDWRLENPRVRAVAYFHFDDFAKSIGRPRKNEALPSSGSLFSLLGLDPLSNLDPAVRELTQTRQLAERTIYYAQRAPSLIDMQVERFTYQVAEMPESTALLDDLSNASLAIERAGNLAITLPELVARERKAAIDQLMSEIDAREQAMLQLASAVRGTLDAGLATSGSVRSTIEALDKLIAQFQMPDDAPSNALSKPFDIADYTAAAREFGATAKELERLAQRLHDESPTLATAATSAGVELTRVVDHMFWRAVQLGLLLIVAALVAGLVYRALAGRFFR
jgi:hypothetical protein